MHNSLQHVTILAKHLDKTATIWPICPVVMGAAQTSNKYSFSANLFPESASPLSKGIQEFE
jgi:hypothetical protein